MSTKEIALRSITELPDDASWDEIRERIDFMAGVRKGLEEIESGKGLSHEMLKKELQSWTTG